MGGIHEGVVVDVCKKHGSVVRQQTRIQTFNVRMKCQTAKQTSVTWTPEDWQLEKMEFNRKTFFFFWHRPEKRTEFRGCWNSYALSRHFRS